MPIRLPSLAAVLRAAGAAARRFPVVSAAALVSAAAAWWLIASDGDSRDAVRLLTAALLALPLGFAIAVWQERGAPSGEAGPTASRALPGAAVVLVACGGFWLVWPRWTDEMIATRFLHLAVVGHLAVAFLPFLGRREPNAFWQFNLRILFRWVEGVVFAAAIFAGLALAIAAVDQLFGVDVDEKAYAYLWVACALLFHPHFFLAGAPRDLGALERETGYPPVIRTFAHLVMVPLTALYLAILSAYFVKVVVTGQWPSGWIGWLVSGAAVLGILTLLLASPPAEQERPAWVTQFERWFWPALLPAAVMVGLAAWKRIDQYGVTEVRYFLSALTLWLFAVAVVYTWRRGLPLIGIPASLAVVALVTFAGPWGAYRTAERSQLVRLERVLDQLGMLREGRIAPTAGGLEAGPATQAANIASYLARMGGEHRFGPWLADRGVVVPAPADTLDAEARDRAFRTGALAALGLAGYRTERQEWVWVSREEAGPVEVRGWDWLVPVTQPREAGTPWPAGDTLAARVAADRRSVEVRRGAEPLVIVDLGAALDSLARWRLRDSPQSQVAPDSLLAATAEAPGLTALVRIRRAGLRDSAAHWRAGSLDASVLLRLAPPAR